MNRRINELIKDLESPFCYYAYLIKDEGPVDYFHFGIWEDGTRSIKEAQQNLASLVKSLIPEGVSKILDVGCGLGQTTYDLSAKGFAVTGISPDKNLMDTARAKFEGSGLSLVTTAFERYRPPEKQDLILFEESTQYINIQTIFSRCRKLLNPAGHILMCDEIKYRNAEEAWFHKKTEILFLARAYGFKILDNRNISDKTLPTRHFAMKRFLENKDLIIKELSEKRDNVAEELDTLMKSWDRFTQMFENGSCGYELFLFQKQAENGVSARLGKRFFRLLYFFFSTTRRLLKKIRRTIRPKH